MAGQRIRQEYPAFCGARAGHRQIAAVILKKRMVETEGTCLAKLNQIFIKICPTCHCKAATIPVIQTVMVKLMTLKFDSISPPQPI